MRSLSPAAQFTDWTRRRARLPGLPRTAAASACRSRLFPCRSYRVPSFSILPTRRQELGPRVALSPLGRRSVREGRQTLRPRQCRRRPWARSPVLTKVVWALHPPSLQTATRSARWQRSMPSARPSCLALQPCGRGRLEQNDELGGQIAPKKSQLSLDYPDDIKRPRNRSPTRRLQSSRLMPL